MPRMQIDNRTVLPCLADYVAYWAERHPERTAAVCRGRRISYRDLDREVLRWSRALLAAGVRKGERVATLSSPRVEFWLAFLATTRIGGIWIGLNPKYSLRECDYVVADAEPRLLLTIASFAGTDLAAHVNGLVERRPALRVVTLDDALPGALSLDAFLEAGLTSSTRQVEEARGDVDTLDPALIVYTSGSTGSPKGAVLSHYGLTYGATLQNRHFALDRPSLVMSFPINHVASVADTCATTLVGGGKIVFQERFDPAASVQATVAERCSMMAGVPTMYQMQMAEPEFERADFTALQLFLWGGAAMPREFIERLASLGKRLLTAYGMTETACHVTYTDRDADVEQLASSIGRPDERVDIRLDSANGADCSAYCDADNPGELLVRGDFLMRGYWRRDAATQDAFTDDGWFKTGDLAHWRDDGTLRLVGRKSDMFKSGGHNVYPREIEQVIEQHPAVALAAVVAIPHPLYQEVGAAFVQPDTPGGVCAAAIVDWCAPRLANYKRPKSVTILDALPLLPVGKVDKESLREAATSQLERASKGPRSG